MRLSLLLFFGAAKKTTNNIPQFIRYDGAVRLLCARRFSTSRFAFVLEALRNENERWERCLQTPRTDFSAICAECRSFSLPNGFSTWDCGCNVWLRRGFRTKAPLTPKCLERQETARAGIQVKISLKRINNYSLFSGFLREWRYDRRIGRQWATISGILAFFNIQHLLATQTNMYLPNFLMNSTMTSTLIKRTYREMSAIHHPTGRTNN